MNEDDIEELTPVQAVMTNIVLSFKLKGGKHIYRHPGIGSDALVERGRETIMQKVVSDIGIDTTLVAMGVAEGIFNKEKFISSYITIINNKS